MDRRGFVPKKWWFPIAVASGLLLLFTYLYYLHSSLTFLQHKDGLSWIMPAKIVVNETESSSSNTLHIKSLFDGKIHTNWPVFAGGVSSKKFEVNFKNPTLISGISLQVYPSPEEKNLFPHDAPRAMVSISSEGNKLGTFVLNNDPYPQHMSFDPLIAGKVTLVFSQFQAIKKNASYRSHDLRLSEMRILGLSF